MNPITRASLAAPNLRVDFHWLGDRFGHSVYAVYGDQSQLIYRSTQSQDFGPVFQELHEQNTDDDGAILFLSGAGGGAHWSMSVQQAQQSIAFDVAARIAHEPLDRLIAYTLEPKGTLESIGSSPSIQSSDPDTTVGRTSARLNIAAKPSDSRMAPLTLQWKYHVAAV